MRQQKLTISSDSSSNHNNFVKKKFTNSGVAQALL
jgi:hypothetical protein